MSFCPWDIMNSMGSVAPVTVRNVDNRYSGMTRQAMHNVNIEESSCNHSCSGKAISITYSDCVFVALGIQNTVRMRHTLSCGLPGSTIFFPHSLISGRIVEKTVLFFSTTFVCNISHSKKNWARYDQKCLLVFLKSTCFSCPILMELEFSRQIFETLKYLFHEKTSSGSRVVSCGQTDSRTDMTKSIVAFRNLAHSPKKWNARESRWLSNICTQHH